MSGEFGSYEGGYFWYQMENASIDCLKSDNDITKLWGEFLKEFAPIARAISWFEAADSGVDYPIEESMKRLPELKKRLDDIQKYVTPFEAIAKQAVRDYIAKKE